MSARAGGSSSLRKKVDEFRSRLSIKIVRRVGPITVREVDGRLIRNQIYIDFTEGGNSEAYLWMPPNEIWLDTDVHPQEMRFVYLHELREMNEMKFNHCGYETAHSRANDAELKARRHPQLYQELMDREIKRVQDGK